MKKNVMALSIAAMIGGLGFAGAASAALTVAESGAGHMLLVPYFNAQNGNMTVLHVVNTDTTNGKAVKVRFRGAANSDDVLDFQVFMSPGDVWTAAVSAGADGVTQLVTADGTCTLPAIAKNTPVSFVMDRLPTSLTGDARANQTREGYVEILNMADIDGASSTTYDPAGLVAVKAPLYTATKHVNGNAPCTSTVLNGTLATEAATPGLLAPSSGLTGSWYIINVPQTTTFAGAMTAIRATRTTQNVFSAQSAGTAALASADPLFRAGVLAPQKYDVPDLSTPYETTAGLTAERQAGDLTKSLAALSVINQYANDASISAKTDWVFSMPTRRYSVAANYAVAASQNAANVTGAGTISYVGSATAANAYRYINSDVNDGGAVGPPVVAAAQFFTAANTTVNTAGQICVTATGQAFYDREETSQVSGAVFSPGQVSRTSLCGEVSVLSFADAGVSVLGGAVARTNVASGTYTNGWGQINFAAPGVPVIGASFIKLTNPTAAAGMAGTYGITWQHTKK